jgi:hypothetical protein
VIPEDVIPVSENDEKLDLVLQLPRVSFHHAPFPTAENNSSVIFRNFSKPVRLRKRALFERVVSRAGTFLWEFLRFLAPRRVPP